jgi:beta-lactamase superfamily II metal-dependent hydrolase
MKKVILTKILIILIGCQGLADVGAPKTRKIKVAVIDTGIDSFLMKSNTLCDSGHKDFTGQECC